MPAMRYAHGSRSGGPRVRPRAHVQGCGVLRPKLDGPSNRPRHHYARLAPAFPLPLSRKRGITKQSRMREHAGPRPDGRGSVVGVPASSQLHMRLAKKRLRSLFPRPIFTTGPSWRCSTFICQPRERGCANMKPCLASDRDTSFRCPITPSPPPPNQQHQDQSPRSP